MTAVKRRRRDKGTARIEMNEVRACAIPYAPIVVSRLTHPRRAYLTARSYPRDLEDRWLAHWLTAPALAVTNASRKSLSVTMPTS